MGYTTNNMLSGTVIGIFAGLAAAAWIYSYMDRKTGGNTKTAGITAGAAGFAVFIVVMTFVVLVDSIAG